MRRAALFLSATLALSACTTSAPQAPPNGSATGGAGDATGDELGPPAFAAWPEIPAPPVGEVQSREEGPNRQGGYWRAEVDDPESTRLELVDLYQRALSRIAAVQRPELGQREGETTLFVESPDGRTAAIVIHTRGPEGTVDIRMELQHPY